MMMMMMMMWASLFSSLVKWGNNSSFFTLLTTSSPQVVHGVLVFWQKGQEHVHAAQKHSSWVRTISFQRVGIYTCIQQHILLASHGVDGVGWSGIFLVSFSTRRHITKWLFNFLSERWLPFSAVHTFFWYFSICIFLYIRRTFTQQYNAVCSLTQLPAFLAHATYQESASERANQTTYEHEHELVKYEHARNVNTFLHISPSLSSTHCTRTSVHKSSVIGSTSTKQQVER